MHILSIKIVSYLCDNEVISDNDRHIYEYGCEAFITSIVDILIAFIFGFIFNQVWQGLIYVSSFFIYRQFAGGYHANSHLKCKLLFSVLLLFFMVTLKLSVLFPKIIISIITLLVFTFSILIAVKFVPIENDNKLLSDYQKNKNRIISIILNLFFSLVAFVSISINIQISIAITVSYFFATFLIIVELIKNKWSVQK
jgi:accessory gene regulator B